MNKLKQEWIDLVIAQLECYFDFYDLLDGIITDIYIEDDDEVCKDIQESIDEETFHGQMERVLNYKFTITQKSE